MHKLASHPQAKLIYLVSALISFGLAWALALRAIDTGSLWQYLITFVLIGLGIKEVVQLIAVLRR